MSRPRILDLFCGAGGAAVGLARAGFEVVGVDIRPQPSYPFALVQADALTADLSGFAAVWASPPCQRYSRTARLWKREHPDLVAPVRAMLAASGLPYIIENVPGAPLCDAVMLCGLSFGLKVFRHRLFESNRPLWAPAHEAHGARRANSHRWQPGLTIALGDRRDVITVAGHTFSMKDAPEAMGINWMKNRAEVAEAIPPAYAEHLGRQLIGLLDAKG